MADTPTEDDQEELDPTAVLADMAADYDAAMTPSDVHFAPFDVRIVSADGLGDQPDTRSDTANKEDEFVAFDTRIQDEFDGLLFLGALSKTFNWAGHRFAIRTLTVDEQLECSLAAQLSQNTAGENLAWMCSIVSCCIVSVDGQPLPVPIDDNVAGFTLRYEYVRRHWFPPTINVVYNQYLGLNAKVTEVIAAMGKAPGQTATPITG